MADRWVWGCVNSNGTRHSGTGFTSSQIMTAVYEIKYDKAFSSVPAVVVTQNYPAWNVVSDNQDGGDPRDNAVLVASNATGCRIKTGDNNGKATPRNFTFIALGRV
jgi:hypothetical protein